MLAHHVLTLTVNPALDLSTEVEKIEPMHKLRCTAPRRDPGGGGINVARVIRRLGGEVSAVFPIGGPAGASLETRLRAEHIHCVPVPISGETREDFTVRECASNRQYRFVMPGPELTAQELAQCLDALHSAETGSDFVVASGSLPPGTGPDFYAQIARGTKAHGRKLIVDTSGAALKAALSEGVWLAKPNLRELRALTGKPLAEESDWLTAAREIVAQGGAEIVALSLAEMGARLVTRGEVWAAHAPPIAPVSTVGAGDSFVGALTWALARDASLPDALRHAVAAGTAALLSHGTELCHAEAVHRLLPDVVVEKM